MPEIALEAEGHPQPIGSHLCRSLDVPDLGDPLGRQSRLLQQLIGVLAQALALVLQNKNFLFKLPQIDPGMVKCIPVPGIPAAGMCALDQKDHRIPAEMLILQLALLVD